MIGLEVAKNRLIITKQRSAQGGETISEMLRFGEQEAFAVGIVLHQAPQPRELGSQHAPRAEALQAKGRLAGIDSGGIDALPDGKKSIGGGEELQLRFPRLRQRWQVLVRVENLLPEQLGPKSDQGGAHLLAQLAPRLAVFLSEALLERPAFASDLLDQARERASLSVRAGQPQSPSGDLVNL